MNADLDVDGLMTDYAARDVPGAAVAVVRKGAVALARAYGAADVEGGVPAAPDTSFRLASITKQFTARAVAMLVEDARLALDTPIRSILPELPPWAGAVKVGHLVAHTSGLPRYEELIPPARTAPLTDADVLRLVASAPGLVFRPGSRFAYDNGGYALLALALEALSGVSFSELLATRIFRPLGMDGTVAHVEGTTTVPRRAFGYRGEDGRFAPADQSVTSAVLGDGGIYSSVLDLAKWDAALCTPGWQPAPAALEPFAAPAGAGAAYGFGWYLDSYRGHARHRHEGWTCGFHNEIQRFPGAGLTVIILTNRAEPSPRPLVEAIARRLL